MPDLPRKLNTFTCLQILQQDTQSGHPHTGSSGTGAQKKHAEAKLVLQLASWMAITGQGAKTDITGEFPATALMVVTFVGGMTCFYAAITGVSRNDMKRVIAYSHVARCSCDHACVTVYRVSW